MNFCQKLKELHEVCKTFGKWLELVFVNHVNLNSRSWLITEVSFEPINVSINFLKHVETPVKWIEIHDVSIYKSGVYFNIVSELRLRMLSGGEIFLRCDEDVDGFLKRISKVLEKVDEKNLRFERVLEYDTSKFVVTISKEGYISEEILLEFNNALVLEYFPTIIGEYVEVARVEEVREEYVRSLHEITKLTLNTVDALFNNLDIFRKFLIFTLFIVRYIAACREVKQVEDFVKMLLNIDNTLPAAIYYIRIDDLVEAKMSFMSNCFTEKVVPRLKTILKKKKSKNIIDLGDVKERFCLIYATPRIKGLTGVNVLVSACNLKDLENFVTRLLNDLRIVYPEIEDLHKQLALSYVISMKS